MHQFRVKPVIDNNHTRGGQESSSHLLSLENGQLPINQLCNLANPAVKNLVWSI
jgi:hypothetical protein